MVLYTVSFQEFWTQCSIGSMDPLQPPSPRISSSLFSFPTIPTLTKQGAKLRSWEGDFECSTMQTPGGWENLIWKAWWVEDAGVVLNGGMMHQVLDEYVVVIIVILTVTDCTFILYLMIVYILHFIICIYIYILLFSPLSILWYRYYYFFTFYFC